MYSKLTFGSWLKFFAVVLVVGVVGCGSDEDTDTQVKQGAAQMAVLQNAALPITTSVIAQDATALKVRKILESRCYYCHGEDGAAEGGLNFILDYDRLVATKQIVPEEPLKSGLYRKIVLDDMPKDDDPLSDDEKRLIKDWIAAGAPSFNPKKAARSFIDPRQVYDYLAKDILEQPEEDRKYIRYFSIVSLYNSGTSDDELDTYRHGLSKLVNSLSRGETIVKPQAVEATKTIYRINIRDYEWEIESWDQIAEQFPYAIEYDFQSLRDVKRDTQTLVPLITADWFVSVAAVPPLYHDLLEMPDNAKDLEFLLSANVDLNIKNGRNVGRAGFNRSGVSGNNRIIERHRTLDGPYWKSYDFDKVDGPATKKNVFARPLGPGVTGGFEHDGGELIYPLPNGLQAYMLVDRKGGRIDKGPISIVQDNNRPDRQVVNGLSCMTCHSKGIIPKIDQVRPLVEADKAAFEAGFGKDGLDSILELYPGQKVLDQWYKQDRDNFAQAVEATGGKVTETEPIIVLARLFEQELDLKTAASESGLTEEQFKRRLHATPDLYRNLGILLIDGGTITRDAYRVNFASLSQSLRFDLVDDLRDPTAKAKLRPQTITLNKDGPEFVLIKPGTFRMGGVINGPNDHPPHEVQITKPFYLAVSELSWSELATIVEVKPVILQDLSNHAVMTESIGIPQPPGFYARPWEDPPDTHGLINSINNSLRLQGFRVRLPTEAEWEYAARAGTVRLPWLGPKREGQPPLNFDEFEVPLVENFRERGSHLPGRSKKANPFGLYDMLGRNMEHVSDFYDENFYDKSPKKDPTGPAERTRFHVLRGFAGGDLEDLHLSIAIKRIGAQLPAAVRLVLEFIENDEEKK